MRVCVVGSGVIGTIYGSTLTRAGTDVVHFVLPDADTPLTRGATVRLLDGRHEPPDEYDLVYRPKLVTDLADAGPVDLVFASVRHYQVAGLLPTLRGTPGAPDIMFFNNYWQTLEGIDAELARERYLWGFPVAGGGWAGDRLEAALLGEVRLGELDGTRTARSERIAAMFERAGLTVNLQTDMLGWLWAHFAIEAGVIGTVISVGDVDTFLDNTDHLQRAVLAVRDALNVVRVRGVDVDAFSDAATFFAPEALVAEGIRAEYQTNLPARKIMQRHTGADELRRIFHDVLNTGRALGVPTPHLDALTPAVDAWDGAARAAAVS